MPPLETDAQRVEWAARNMAFNLDFIPDDKLAWKPAPAAKSALEVAHHTVNTLNRLGFRLSKPDATDEELGAKGIEEFTDRATAKSQLIKAAVDYASVLRTLKTEDLGKPVKMFFGTFPLAFLAGMPLTDVLHHHGQIAYIQTLLGDGEPHFDFSLFPSQG